MEIEITTMKTIDMKDVWSCLVGAFEGGSGYWARTRISDKAGLKRIQWDAPERLQENETRKKAFEIRTGRSYLPYGNQCDDDFTWLQVNGFYLYSHQVPFLGGEVTVYDAESPDEILGVLNQSTIENGLLLMQEDSPRHFNDFIIGNDDAITSDVMLQYMVMGSVVFG